MLFNQGLLEQRKSYVYFVYVKQLHIWWNESGRGGVEVDKENAVHYYELAVMGGNPKARNNLVTGDSVFCYRWFLFWGELVWIGLECHWQWCWWYNISISVPHSFYCSLNFRLAGPKENSCLLSSSFAREEQAYQKGRKRSHLPVCSQYPSGKCQGICCVHNPRSGAEICMISCPPDSNDESRTPSSEIH